MFDKKYRLKADGTLLTEQEFRSLFPNKSLPNPLAPKDAHENGADVIMASPAPAITEDQTTHVVGVVIDEKGNWVWKWTVEDKPAEQVAQEIASKRDNMIKQIDADVDQIYEAVMGNRASEYALAEQEALAYKAADYSGTSPMTVRVWAKAKGKTNKWAADDIIATAAAWRQAQIQIREQRLTLKEALRAATTHSEVSTATTAWNTFTQTIKVALGLIPAPVATPTA